MIETVKELIGEKEIEHRVSEIANMINEEFKGETVTLLGVLKGGLVLLVEIAKRLDVTVEFEFIEVSSYGDATVSTGIIKISKDLSHPITDKNVIVVEDIIDSGKTLSYLVKHLQAQEPKKLKICTLLDKLDRRENFDCTPDYIGFNIPDEFVVGYGLDYAQRYRNLPYIGVLSFNE